MLYINSIVKVLLDSVTCLSFADDVRIYTVVRSDRPTDKVNLQNALDRVSDWSVKWQMPISAGKCSVTVYGKSVTITKPYYLCGCRLKFSSCFFFFLLLFFPRLISAVADWMSTILRHMVWS